MDVAAAREKEHLLALKVMRLTKPSLMIFHPRHSEGQDLHSELWQKFDQLNMDCLGTSESFACGQLLTLPQHFGNIFLGENFSSYISVHNGSNQVCTDVIIKSDLQTSSQRLPLSGLNNTSASSLPPNASIDDVIHHEVKELGTHILVCAVSYTSQSGEKLYFRKFFKFQVLKPLDVKTKFYNAESDEVYLEAQIQNITPTPIHMEHVCLQPSPQYSVASLNTISSSNTKVFGNANYITPMDVHQYLYCLTPKTSDNKSLKGVTDIGKLDIVWQTNLGEKGRLQTSQLQRVVPGYGDIRLSVRSCPDVVSLESTFDISCLITNSCDRSMDLTLCLQNQVTAGMSWCGISGRQLGKLLPNSSLPLTLTLIATAPGLQTISGLRLTDTFLKRTYEHDEITQVFVYTES